MTTREQGNMATGSYLTRRRREFLGIVVIGALAVVLAACAPAPSPGPPRWASSEPGVVNEINNQRTALGLSSLATNAALTDQAAGWAAHLTVIGVLQHQNLNAVLPGWHALGETTLMGGCGLSDQAIVNAWMNSAEHHDILMSPAYTAVGVAAVCDAGGHEWVVADFGG